MPDRVFGPNRGAGVQVREREPDRNVVPGMLGSTVMVGVAERGVHDDIIIVPSEKARRRKLGGILDPADFNAMSFASLEAPLAAKHFYEHSAGSGYLVFCRVVPKSVTATDDETPDTGKFYVYNREDIPKYIGYLEAKNGGRWAGQREMFLGDITGTPATDFPNPNEIQLADETYDGGTISPDGIAGDGYGFKLAGGHTFKPDEWRGATVSLEGLSQTYTVVSNTTDGILTFASDIDLDADWAAAGPPAGPTYHVTITRDNQNYRGQEKRMSVLFKDGALDPTAYFGMEVYVDGDLLLGDYENLSMDTTSPYYWVDVINNDPNNDLFTVTDSFTGGRTVATARPANRFGLSDSLTTTTLTIQEPYIETISAASGDWVPALSAISYGSDVKPQWIRVLVTAAGGVGADDIEVVSDYGTRVYAVTGGDLSAGIAVTTDDDMIDFTITTSSGTVAAGDYVDIYVNVLYEDELVGGKVYPDVTTTKSYTIISNDHNTVTVSSAADLTNAGALSGGEQYRLEWPERFGEGYDGNVADMTSSDYEPIFDFATSNLRKLKTMNLGLVKLAIPGIGKPSEAKVLQKKALNDLCVHYNWQYRVEIPDEYETEEDALDWINNDFGRHDLAVAFFPMFNDIRDPFASSGSAARPYEISMVGMQLGREAQIANNYGGYHKAEAGVEVTFPLIIDSTVLGRPDDFVRLNEELLNPAGVNVFRWGAGGEMIAWGDRTLDNTTAFRFKHKREQLSHYTNVLRENFDWAIFKINDPIADADVLAALHEYFLQEYRKRAIRGDSFTGGRNPAAIIKMDKTNNTDATRAQGDQIVDISVRFADVVERLKISIGAMGIMEVS